jgi:hypothetical protein
VSELWRPNPAAEIRRGGRTIGLVVLCALAAGLLLLALFPSYRPRAALASNERFFPQIEPAALDESAGPDAPPEDE